MIGGIISRALQAGHFPILLVFKVWVLFVVPTAKGYGFADWRQRVPARAPRDATPAQV